jgi:signal recognition particle subunit SRP54
MTPHERNTPHVIDGKRRLRIAKGSGTSVQQVNRLLDARKQMEKMMKGMSKGKMPQIPGLAPETGNGAPARAVPRKAKKKRPKNRR